MEERISIITLGGKDLERSFCFYHEGLGFKTSSKVEDGIIFFQTSGTRLALYPLAIANAVEEVKAQGDTTALSEIPGWRTLKSDGYLNDKYPGGQENQKRRLEKEGLTVKPRGKKL